MTRPESNAPTRHPDPIRDLWEIAYQTAERLKTIEHVVAELRTIITQLANERK